jgi:hypothetical protein
MTTDIYPLDGGTGAPRSWEQIRADALTAARAAGSRRTSDIVDAVLSVVDDETVERMTARLLEDTRLRSMDFRNGARMDLEPSRELAALWVGAARGMLGDAVNYCETEVEMGREDPPGAEMTVGLAGDPERFVFRVQRAGQLTPHKARMLAERRAADAEAERDRLAGLPDRWAALKDIIFCLRPDGMSGEAYRSFVVESMARLEAGQ